MQNKGSIAALIATRGAGYQYGIETSDGTQIVVDYELENQRWFIGAKRAPYDVQPTTFFTQEQDLIAAMSAYPTPGRAWRIVKD